MQSVLYVQLQADVYCYWQCLQYNLAAQDDVVCLQTMLYPKQLHLWRLAAIQYKNHNSDVTVQMKLYIQNQHLHKARQIFQPSRDEECLIFRLNFLLCHNRFDFVGEKHVLHQLLTFSPYTHHCKYLHKVSRLWQAKFPNDNFVGCLPIKYESNQDDSVSNSAATA